MKSLNRKSVHAEINEILLSKPTLLKLPQISKTPLYDLEGIHLIPGSNPCLQHSLSPVSTQLFFNL